MAIGEDHPRFQEWLTKACFHLQTITSFVYIGPYPDGGPYFTRRAMKLPEKYYAKTFDAFCESPKECRDRLESLRNEDAGLFPNGITGELVDSTFAKYLAVKRYTLPMLANTSEFNYFSFYRHILLYVVSMILIRSFLFPTLATSTRRCRECRNVILILTIKECL